MKERLRAGHGLMLAALAGPLLCFSKSAQPALPPLTTVSGSPRLPGKFVWADLVTDYLAAGQEFYAQLFGWTFRDVGGDGNHGDFIVTPSPIRPEQPIYNPPEPRPTPLPSIPSAPRPMPMPATRR